MSLLSDDMDANLNVFLVLLMTILLSCIVGFLVTISMLFCLLERKKPGVCKRCTGLNRQSYPGQTPQSETSNNSVETTLDRAASQNNVDQNQEIEQIYTDDPLSTRPGRRPPPLIQTRPPRQRVTFSNGLFDSPIGQEINRATPIVESTRRSIYIEKDYPARDTEPRNSLPSSSEYNDTESGVPSTLENNDSENLQSHYEEVELCKTKEDCDQSLQSESRHLRHSDVSQYEDSQHDDSNSDYSHHDDSNYDNGHYDEVNINPNFDFEEETGHYEIPDGFLHNNIS